MVKVFSFCLYGPPSYKYYPLPILQNIYLIGTYFPDWKVYIYAAPDVETAFLEQVVMYSNVVLRRTTQTGPENMFERFFAIDEPDVEIMIVRDADSRVHWKDRWAINDFLNKPEFVAHTIRDNIEHTSKMMGGMWGIRKEAGIRVRELYEIYKKMPHDRGYGRDQSFLTDYIYPRVFPKLLVHFSNGRRLEGEHAVEFPFAYTEKFYCGKLDGPEFVDTDKHPSDRLRIVGGRFKF